MLLLIMELGKLPKLFVIYCQVGLDVVFGTSQ